MTKNTSRRLKHHRESATFHIKSANIKSNLEEIILKNLGDFIQLSHKTMLKGGDKNIDIKKVEGEANIQTIQAGCLVALKVHIHHYANVYFDLPGYLARLNTELELKPASVVQVLVKTEKPKTQQPELIEMSEESNNSFFSLDNIK